MSFFSEHPVADGKRSPGQDCSKAGLEPSTSNDNKSTRSHSTNLQGDRGRITKSSHRFSKPEHFRSALSSIRQSRRRVALHRILTSLFNTNRNAESDDSTIYKTERRQTSSASSTPSKPLSSRHASTPNLEFISPGAFLFSGPSLTSVYPSSRDNSTSRFQSLAESGSESPEVWNVRPALHRSHSNSVDSVSLLEDAILEPLQMSPDGLVRTVSDVLLGLASPFDELEEPIFEDDEDSLSSLMRSRLTFPKANTLPNEILQQIYGYLSPKDFNAARHTCRTWQFASLDRRLLMTMLRRGGWQGNIKYNDRDSLSRRLSRECSLGNARQPNPFIQVAETDFDELSNGYAGRQSKGGSGLVITASVCGHYLLVARETIIFVYQLESDSLRPLTSVTCPRRVLAMSMDTSGDEFVLAALLVERMGIWCNLQRMPKARKDASSKTSSSAAEVLVTPSASGVEEYTPRSFKSINIRGSFEDINLEDVDNVNNYGSHEINQTWPLSLRGAPIISERQGHVQASSPFCGIPLEPGPSTIYRNLCSDTERPRSVAICPRRRAVAFGCKTGLELHWVDKLGTSMHKLFPLTAPSDVVHFFPSPPGEESLNTLRVISSAVEPKMRPEICRKFCVPGLAGKYCCQHDEAQNLKYLHWRAVPLSDGRHVLFVDPSTGDLVLGSDARSDAPTKLLKKIRFVPAASVSEKTPRLYNAAADLDWGVRIAAVYGNDVVFYSVPRDIFVSTHWEETDDVGMDSGAEDENHWRHWLEDPAESNNPTTPITVRGRSIGMLQSVCEVAIFTDPDITIWTFGLDGKSKTWQVGHPTPPSLALQAKGNKEERSAEDIGYYETMIGGRFIERLPKALHVDRDGEVDILSIGGYDGWYDRRGNVAVSHPKLDLKVEILHSLGEGTGWKFWLA